MSRSQQPFDALSTEHLQRDLKSRCVRGGMLNIASQGSRFLVQSISTVVLARLLTPGDFGLVAMVTAVTGLGQAFADLGLSEATIQRHKITHDQVSALFWINLIIGLALTAVTVVLAPVLASFYREARLVDVTLVLAPTFLIGGLRVQPDALLKRQMRYKSMAIRDIAANALGVIVAIIMAWRGAGYWALVAFPLTTNFAQMAVSWLMVDWRPSFPRRGAEVGSMVAFGSNVAGSYLASRLSESVSNTLIGWWWGAGPLGLYSRAYNLLLLPVRQFSIPVGSVVVPAFSRLQSDSDRSARYYLRSANLIMWGLAPMFGFLFAASHPVILLVLGHQWRAAAPVFQFLAISALAYPLLQLATWFLISQGQSRRAFKLRSFISVVIIGSYAVGLPFGIEMAALSGSLALLALLPWMLKLSFRGTTLTLQRLGRAIVYPISFSLLGVCLAEIAQHVIGPQRIVQRLLLVAVSFTVAYSLSAFVGPVRREISSFARILSELRPTAQTVQPAA